MGLKKIRQMLALMKTEESTSDFLTANLVSNPQFAKDPSKKEKMMSIRQDDMNQ